MKKWSKILALLLVLTVFVGAFVLGACKDKQNASQNTLPTQEELCAEFDAIVSDQLSLAQIQKIFIDTAKMQNYRAKSVAHTEYTEKESGESGTSFCIAELSFYDANTKWGTEYSVNEKGDLSFPDASEYILPDEIFSFDNVDQETLEKFKFSEEKKGYLVELIGDDGDTVISCIIKFKDGHIMGLEMQVSQKDSYGYFSMISTNICYDFDQVQLSDVQPQ